MGSSQNHVRVGTQGHFPGLRNVTKGTSGEGPMPLCDLTRTSDKSLVQFSSAAPSGPTYCDPMNHSTPGLPVHHQLLQSTQTHVD